MSKQGDRSPNFVNRTLWTGDNLDILRGMNSECVDLIYLDPPFNSNQDYAAPVGSAAAGAAFKDTWTLSDLDVAWLGIIAEEQPALAHVVRTAGLVHSKSMQSYLTMMAVRLLEMRRVLKPTGSIYLHCDPTASHYLKQLMDAVFGRANFRSEITWRRINSTGRGRKRLANNADVILYYVNGQAFTWNQPYRPHDQKYIDRFYRHSDPDGRRYRLDNLKGAGLRNGHSGAPWRGVDPSDTGSHWAIPNATLPAEAKQLSSQAKLDLLDEMGRIYWPPTGKIPSYKRYLDEMPGTAVDTIWEDIKGVGTHAKERTGYPTQKPLALLERIIKTSSSEGDLVLDPFAGCATACVAAERLNRRWVGIDLSAKAVELVQYRLKQQEPGIALWANKVVARTDIPQRTDISVPKNYRKNKHVLFGQQEGMCGGCKMDFPFKIFEVDHVVPKSKGGTDHIENLQLLCPHCNKVKGANSQEYLLAALAAS